MAITAWIVATVKNATSRPWLPNHVPWGGRLSPTANNPAAKPPVSLGGGGGRPG